MKIICEALELNDDEEFEAMFPHIQGLMATDYIQAIKDKKIQLFSLVREEEISYMLTSITSVYGVKYLNILELCGDFGYSSYPEEFLELVKNMGKSVSADELRIMLTRDGGIKIVKQWGFELKYSEYGMNLK